MACFANVIIGYVFSHPEHLWIPIVGIAVLYPTFISFYIYYVELAQMNKLKLVQELTAAALNKGLPTLTADQINEKRKNGDKFVMYDNFVCNVEKLVKEHPGGMLLISENIGRDVSRYMDATEAFSSSFSPHDHLYLSYRYLINSLAVGVFVDENQIIKSADKPSSFIDSEAVLVKRRSIAEETGEIIFKLPDSSEKFASFLEGHQWIGRHFAVSSRKLNKTRYYSLCLCLGELFQARLNTLLENCVRAQRGESLLDVNIDDASLFDDTLKLYAKRYRFKNALSDHLFSVGESSNANENLNNLSDNKDFLLKGPLGVGLNLPETLDGVYVAYGGGTGVFCFLDLVGFVIRYVSDKIGSKFNKQNKISVNEQFKVGSNFKLIYFSSFKTDKAAVFHNECQALDKLDKEHGLGIFEYVPRISEVDKKRWDASFMQTRLSNKKIEKVFICGPVAFQETVQQTVLESGCATLEQIHKV